VILTFTLIIVVGLVLSLAFLSKRMKFIIRENEFLINFGFFKRKIPFSSIRDVKLSKTTLLFRLFSASWPGFHWGPYKAKDVGKVWVYSAKMRGVFVILELVDGNKVAVSPENPEQLFNEFNSQRSRFRASSFFEVIESSKKLVYFQVASVAGAFWFFLDIYFGVILHFQK
jgi:hypothetical protein